MVISLGEGGEYNTRRLVSLEHACLGTTSGRYAHTNNAVRAGGVVSCLHTADLGVSIRLSHSSRRGGANADVTAVRSLHTNESRPPPRPDLPTILDWGRQSFIFVVGMTENDERQQDGHNICRGAGVGWDCGRLWVVCCWNTTLRYGLLDAVTRIKRPHAADPGGGEGGETPDGWLPLCEASSSWHAR